MGFRLKRNICSTVNFIPILITLFLILVVGVFNMFGYNGLLEKDSAMIKVLYNRTMVMDTLNPQNRVSQILTLQANRNRSVFYSEAKWAEKQKMFTDIEYYKSIALNKVSSAAISKLEDNIVYRDYNKSQTTEYQRYDLTDWKYVEDFVVPEWVMTDSICKILDYECIMATAEFRGRTWIAFFAPDIPIPEGPWKLCGLPGIILKAYDQKHHYDYEATAIINHNPGRVVYFNDNNSITITDRINGLKHRRRCLSENLAAKIASTYGLNIKNVDKFKPKSYNYDFEETDYPHE